MNRLQKARRDLQKVRKMRKTKGMPSNLRESLNESEMWARKSLTAELALARRPDYPKGK